MRELEVEFESYATLIRRKMIYERILQYYEIINDRATLPPVLATEKDMRQVIKDKELERRLYIKIVEEQNGENYD